MPPPASSGIHMKRANHGRNPGSPGGNDSRFEVDHLRVEHFNGITPKKPAEVETVPRESRPLFGEWRRVRAPPLAETSSARSGFRGIRFSRPDLRCGPSRYVNARDMRRRFLHAIGGAEERYIELSRVNPPQERVDVPP